MLNKKQLKNMFALSKARAQLREKQFEKAIEKIAQAKREFKKTTDELRCKLKDERLKVYEGPMDDIRSMVGWLEAQHKREKEIEEEMKDVSKVKQLK